MENDAKKIINLIPDEAKKAQTINVSDIWYKNDEIKDIFYSKNKDEISKKHFKYLDCISQLAKEREYSDFIEKVNIGNLKDAYEKLYSYNNSNINNNIELIIYYAILGSICESWLSVIFYYLYNTGHIKKFINEIKTQSDDLENDFLLYLENLECISEPKGYNDIYNIAPRKIGFYMLINFFHKIEVIDKDNYEWLIYIKECRNNIHLTFKDIKNTIKENEYNKNREFRLPTYEEYNDINYDKFNLIVDADTKSFDYFVNEFYGKTMILMCQ